LLTLTLTLNTQSSHGSLFTYSSHWKFAFCRSQFTSSPVRGSQFA